MMTGKYTRQIKDKAYELGFTYVGVAKAEQLVDDAFRLEKWLNQNHHGKMSYMANHFDKRIDPTKLVDGAKSVITLMLNYFPEQLQPNSTYKIAKYAYGEDYHFVIRKKLNELLQFINETIGEVNGRGFVDSAPVLERAWAVKSGLGWVGKNGNLISKQSGSFFFLATLIIDFELEYDLPYLKDYCGTCTKCIDSCPTNAILPNKEINGSQCISYYTIELKDALIETDRKWNDWIFGCDICQDVCPWNRFSSPHQIHEFNPIRAIITNHTEEWDEIEEQTFKNLFKNSPLKRTGFTNFIRNIKFLRSN
jgi:epoxyqueuosine reductase